MVLLAIFILIGLLTKLFAHYYPISKVQGKTDYTWDWIGLGFALMLTSTASIHVDKPLRAYLGNIEALSYWHSIIETIPFWSLLILNLIVLDFFNYWAHRFLHNRTIWNVHAWHHSSKVLYWVSGMRTTPVQVMILTIPSVLSYVFIPVIQVGVISLMIFNFFNQHFLHSCIRIPFAREIEYIFVTPRYHRIHHSSTKCRTDSNYSFIFTFWDRLFGSYTDPDKVSVDEPLGLDYEINKGLAMLGLPAKR